MRTRDAWAACWMRAQFLLLVVVILRRAPLYICAPSIENIIYTRVRDHNNNNITCIMCGSLRAFFLVVCCKYARTIDDNADWNRSTSEVCSARLIFFYLMMAVFFFLLWYCFAVHFSVICIWPIGSVGTCSAIEATRRRRILRAVAALCRSAITADSCDKCLALGVNLHIKWKQARVWNLHNISLYFLLVAHVWVLIWLLFINYFCGFSEQSFLQKLQFHIYIIWTNRIAHRVANSSLIGLSTFRGRIVGHDDNLFAHTLALMDIHGIIYPNII